MAVQTVSPCFYVEKSASAVLFLQIC